MALPGPGSLVGAEGIPESGDVPTWVGNGPDGYAAWAPGGGGSQSGAARVRGPFPFAFNTANLNTGIPICVMTVDDILLDAWIETDTAFDGTTPLCDFGSGIGSNFGIFNDEAGPIDMTLSDVLGGSQNTLAGQNQSLVGASAAASGPRGVAPSKILIGGQWFLWVSQDGQKGGAATGASDGSAALYVKIATPSVA